MFEDIGKKITPFLNLRGQQAVVFADGILDLEAEIRHLAGGIGVVKQSGLSLFLLGHSAGNRTAKNWFFFHFFIRFCNNSIKPGNRVFPLPEANLMLRNTLFNPVTGKYKIFSSNAIHRKRYKKRPPERALYPQAIRQSVF